MTIDTAFDTRPASEAPTPNWVAGVVAAVPGRAFTLDDPAYDELRRVWNLAYEHSPAVVVRPTSAHDVAVAVRHAALAHAPVVVQATGHGIVGVAERDAMLIITSELDDVAVDAAARTARIGAGAKWEKVLGPAVAAGLAPLLGSTPDVSAVGYTLGGGMGWLARKYGLSADHVRSIEVVTADGRIRTASPDDDADLFWALRGGGAGSLGVVTAIEIDLVPVTSMYAGNLLYPASIAREVAAHYRRWLDDVPDELTSSLSLMNFPPLEEVPEPIRGRSFVIVRGAFLGPDADGERLLDHWRSWRAPELDMWGPMPFADVAMISNDPVDPMPGLSSTEWLDEITDELVDVLVAALFEQDGPSPLTFAEIRHAGGAIARQPEFPNAYGNRDRQHVLQFVGVAAGPELVALEAFVERLRTDLVAHVSGAAYLNFLEGEEKVRRTRDGFDPESYERLRRIKAAVDPSNIFSHGLALV